MGKKQKSKAQAVVDDTPADKSSLIDEDALVDEESIPEFLDTDTDNTVNLEDKIADLEEALLRSRAELDNAFKRNISDVEKAHKYGVERLLNELLPVVDNLEHALNNFSKNSTNEDREGVELTLKSFESALDKFGIRPIYPTNEHFDPVKHEAAMTL